jgi:hypothetical protein
LSLRATKLVALAESPQSWKDSEYGQLFRFCDSGTFRKVVQIWEGYIVADRKTRNEFSAKLKSDIKKSADTKTILVGNSGVLTGFRSASPAALSAVNELPKLHSEYLKLGTTTGEQEKEANPMFNSNGTLHYSLDPLFGFHLAPAYIPLAATSPFKASAKSTRKVVDTARLEFRAWGDAFKKCSKHIVLRFFTGDALAFCQTLQQIKHGKNNNVANCYRSQNSSEPLLLDSEDYKSGGSSPLRFTAIDTSNLVDHLGPLNILMAASPLLENKTYATLFTELLVKYENTRMDAINNLLCGDFLSMSILLGLIPVEYITKATVTSSTEETMLSAVTNGRNGKDQMLIRINWKRTLSSPDSAAIIPICFDPSDLASMLYKVYLTMFRHENHSHLFSGGTSAQAVSHELQYPQILHYHRGSFAILVQLVKSRVSDDWNGVVDRLLTLIEHDTTLFIGRNYLQELYVNFHLLGVYTVDTLKSSPNTLRTLNRSVGVSTWKSLPPLVCVTLKVPRSQLKSSQTVQRAKLGCTLSIALYCHQEDSGRTIMAYCSSVSAKQHLKVSDMTLTLRSTSKRTDKVGTEIPHFLFPSLLHLGCSYMKNSH